MQISDRVGARRVSGIVRMTEATRQLRAEGRTIHDLSEGEPDFPTPPHVIAAAHDAMLAGQTKYTSVAGTNELRAAVARKFRNENGLSFEPCQIVVGTGAKQLVFNALLASLNPGDEVIIPVPHWVSYPEMVEIADGRPVIVQTAQADGFKLRPDALESAISSRTRWLILNSPCNPTGTVYSGREMQRLADVLRRHPDVAILTDDIYEKIIFDGASFESFGAVAPDLCDRVLTVNGASKTYAMTGWRIGYAGGPALLIDAMVKLQGQSTTNASSVGQAAALAALEGPQDFLADWLDQYTRRRDLVVELLSGNPALGVPTPQGAIYCFVDCRRLLAERHAESGVPATDFDFVEFLIREGGVSLVPGSEFGTPGYFRICFARPEHVLRAACARIAETLDRFAREPPRQ